MRILIAEDESASRRLLEATLRRWQYGVVSAVDGAQAWHELQAEEAPGLAILDWMMPEIDGVELCRRVRSTPRLRHLYLIILTARDATDDLATALDAGADDYVTKPFDRRELHARIRVGERVLRLQGALAARVSQLEDSLARERRLQGLLPICSYCKKIRNDRNYWQQVERYIEEHTGAAFSHGICPDCYRTIVQPQLDAMGPPPAPLEDDSSGD